jgi:hypothetical protein
MRSGKPYRWCQLPQLHAAMSQRTKPLRWRRSYASSLSARAAAEAEVQIHSHALPETGSSPGWKGAKTSVQDSPIVKAAEQLANVGKEK